jgi:predicted site-specific integrase-resolvase
MQQQFPDHCIITDVASGINFKRKGLRSILELAAKGMVSEVVVAYRDRLCRFAFDLLEWILCLHGVKLLVLNKSLESNCLSGGQSAELAEDLLAIINVFNCRVNGQRKYKKSHPKGAQDGGAEKVKETASQSGPQGATLPQS